LFSGDEARSVSRVRDNPRATPKVHAAIIAGLCFGLLTSTVALSPAGHWIERTLALNWIFTARGERSSPADVVIVSMDERGADLPVVTRDDRRWSRHLYAALIERLGKAGAAAIVLDIAFEDRTDEAADQALERALSRSDRVVLFQRLTRTDVGDVPVPPLPRFAKVARAHAVFPLPKLAQRIDYYWPFFHVFEPVSEDDLGGSMNNMHTRVEYALTELPSLPVAALQLKVLYELGDSEFEQFLRERGHMRGTRSTTAFAAHRSLVPAMIELRRTMMGDRFKRESTLQTAWSSVDQDTTVSPLLHALLAVFATPGELQLNFYGPSRTIKTLDHDEVIGVRGISIEALLESISGKVVFVGHSDRSPIDQKDGFRTVYTGDDGVDVSGVEIAATAFANLADGSTLRPATPEVVVLVHVLLGVVAVLIALRARAVHSVIFIVMLAIGYFAVVVHTADVTYRLLPLGVPLLLLLPFALIASILFHHIGSLRLIDRLSRGMRGFLPSRALRDIESDQVERAKPELLYGACMISDVQDYARLSEFLPSERLTCLSREYFALLAEQARRAGGELIDLEGDSMTAVWLGEERVRRHGHLAAHAAVEIMDAVEKFNERHSDTPFTTRIGLHAGEVTAVNIGGGQTYRHRVIGDVVNSTSRLEGLNKRLGTSVLATRAVIDHASHLNVRRIGTFVLKGKSEALEVFEIVGHRTSTPAGEHIQYERFAHALTLLEQGRPRESERCFVDFLRAVDSDGPARFYVDLINGRGPPDVSLDEGGIVRVFGK